jgi:hypothetical protein
MIETASELRPADALCGRARVPAASVSPTKQLRNKMADGAPRGGVGDGWHQVDRHPRRLRPNLVWSVCGCTPRKGRDAGELANGGRSPCRH